jgi:hypothetical protein
MELFQKAEEVRLRSRQLADDDEETVCQDRNGAAKNARWTVEIVENATATQDWVLWDVDVVQI